ncbi:phage tail tape measure protein, partial [bacterium]
MSRLSGVVDLDTKGALANLRKLRGELQATTKSNTTVKVGFDTKAAKSELGKLKTDIAGLKKLGAQSKVDLAIKADTKGALDGLGKVSKALKDIGKNKRVTITVDVSDAKRRTRELSEVDKRAAEDKKRAIREADRERERADKAAIAGAKAVASAQKRAINEAKVAAGQLADKFSASATRGGLAILGGLGLAAKKAIDFEDAFAGVTKTVKANDAQLASLSGRLRSMSKEIPVAATELSHIAQTAGQLGIHVPNIAKFTRVIADLGVSTNLTAEQGALELAKFANITKMSERDFDRLGSSIVDLGNHFATTEKDVSSMSLRIATVGAQVGLSQTQILGYATAISSLGIKTEAGGSSIGAVFAKLEDATQKGGGALKVFSHIAGQSTSAFKRQFDKDASGATLRFIKGLAQMKKEGGNVIGTLTDLGLGERRTRST